MTMRTVKFTDKQIELLIPAIQERQAYYRDEGFVAEWKILQMAKVKLVDIQLEQKKAEKQLRELN